MRDPGQYPRGGELNFSELLGDTVRPDFSAARLPRVSAADTVSDEALTEVFLSEDPVDETQPLPADTVEPSPRSTDDESVEGTTELFEVEPPAFLYADDSRDDRPVSFVPSGEGTHRRPSRRTALGIAALAVVGATVTGTVMASGGSSNPVAQVEASPHWLQQSKDWQQQPEDVLAALQPTIKDVINSHDVDVKVEITDKDGHTQLGMANPLKYQPELVKILEVVVLQYGGNTKVGGASYGVFPVTAAQLGVELPQINAIRLAYNEPTLPTDAERKHAAKFASDVTVAQGVPRASLAAGARVIADAWLKFIGGKQSSPEDPWTGVYKDKLFGPVPEAFLKDIYAQIPATLGAKGKYLTTAEDVSLAFDHDWTAQTSPTFSRETANIGPAEDSLFAQQLVAAIKGQQEYAKVNGGISG